jgi:hypothetical protein
MDEKLQGLLKIVPRRKTAVIESMQSKIMIARKPKMSNDVVFRGCRP